MDSSDDNQCELRMAENEENERLESSCDTMNSIASSSSSSGAVMSYECSESLEDDLQETVEDITESESHKNMHSMDMQVLLKMKDEERTRPVQHKARTDPGIMNRFSFKRKHDGNNNQQQQQQERPHQVSQKRKKQGQYAYEEVSVIGNGAYGDVYKGKDLRNPGNFVALKRIRVNCQQEEGIPLAAVREIAMLRQIDIFEHPNIVRFFDVCSAQCGNGDMCMVLVFEYIEQDLAKYLQNHSAGLEHCTIKDITHQILCGVDFLHTNRIIHRDLKPQNVLINNQGKVKLADFGLARLYSFQMVLTSVVVTLWYRSPEVLLKCSYASPVDLWSVGCILAELYLNGPLFPGDNDLSQLKKIFKIIGLPKESEWEEDFLVPRASLPVTKKQSFEDIIPGHDQDVVDLLNRLLEFDQTKRISASDALNHPYFSGLLQPSMVDHASSSESSQSLARGLDEIFGPSPVDNSNES